MQKTIFHVDIDAFYASVEQRDNPSLKGKAVIVGALPGHRGVVAACSYEARRFGIHSAMPISQAYRRCPRGVYLTVRMQRYLEISRHVMAVLESYTPEFHQVSVDEAFLDLTGTERLLGAPEDVAAHLKAEIRENEGLTLSIGIAPNAYLAKLASEAGKPDGLVQVLPGGEIAFLDTLQLKNLWGVGGKTLEQILDLGISSVPQLRSFSLEMLKPMLGDGASRFLYNAVRGGNANAFLAERKSHSISGEVTFEIDRRDAESLRRVLLELSQQIMSRLVNEGQRCKTVVLKLRYHDFTTTTAQKTLSHWVTSSEEIYRTAQSLLDKRWDGHTPIRLIGVGLSGVSGEETDEQLELFQQRDDRTKKVEQTVIGLKKKMSGVTLTRASLLNLRSPRRPGGSDRDFAKPTTTPNAETPSD